MLEFEVDDPAALTQDLDENEQIGDIVTELVPAADKAKKSDPSAEKPPAPDDDTPKIVSLDQFRKK